MKDKVSSIVGLDLGLLNNGLCILPVAGNLFLIFLLSWRISHFYRVTRKKSKATTPFCCRTGIDSCQIRAGQCVLQCAICATDVLAISVIYWFYGRYDAPIVVPTVVSGSSTQCDVRVTYLDLAYAIGSIPLCLLMVLIRNITLSSQLNPDDIRNWSLGGTGNVRPLVSRVIKGKNGSHHQDSKPKGPEFHPHTTWGYLLFWMLLFVLIWILVHVFLPNTSLGMSLCSLPRPPGTQPGRHPGPLEAIFLFLLGTGLITVTTYLARRQLHDVTLTSLRTDSASSAESQLKGSAHDSQRKESHFIVAHLSVCTGTTSEMLYFWIASTCLWIPCFEYLVVGDVLDTDGDGSLTSTLLLLYAYWCILWTASGMTLSKASCVRLCSGCTAKGSSIGTIRHNGDVTRYLY